MRRSEYDPKTRLNQHQSLSGKILPHFDINNLSTALKLKKSWKRAHFTLNYSIVRYEGGVWWLIFYHRSFSNGQSCRHTKFQNRSTFPSWPSAGIRGWKTNGMGHVQQAMLHVQQVMLHVQQVMLHVQQVMLSFNPIIMPLRGPTYKLSFSVFQLSWNCKLGRVWQYF